MEGVLSAVWWTHSETGICSKEDTEVVEAVVSDGQG